VRPHLPLALVLLAPLLLQGCGKEIVEPEPPVFTYPDRSTPKNTVMRMAAAFERRDSVVTGSVYSDTYEGSSTDNYPFPGETLTFTRADEVRTVGAMALANRVYVDMELYSFATWRQIHYAGDPTGWVTLQIPYFRISVQDTHGDGFNVNPTYNETWVFEFTLEPTPDSSSPTDTTWTIVRWTESRASL